MRAHCYLALILTTSIAASAAHANEPMADSRVKLTHNIVAYNGTPSFTIEVPAGSVLVKRSDPKVMVAALQTPDNVIIEASVAKVGPELVLANAGLRYFEVMRRVVGRDHRLVLHQPVRLPGNIDGYRTDIAWSLVLPNKPPLPLHSTIVSTIQNGVWVFVAVHPKKASHRYIRVAQSIRLSP